MQFNNYDNKNRSDFISTQTIKRGALMPNDKSFVEFIHKNKHVESRDVNECMKAVVHFQDYLKTKGIWYASKISARDAADYLKSIRGHDANISRTIGILTDYAFFIENNDLFSEFVLLRDAWNVMNRSSEITKEMEPIAWEKVFGDNDPPEVGATLDEMADYSREFQKKMLEAMTRERFEAIMVKNAHSWEPDWDWDEKSVLDEAGTIDKYLAECHQKMIEELEGCRDRGELYFTQEIDDEVVDFVKKNLKIERIGNIIRQKRIPYMVKNYLNAADPVTRRYYACHCPWKRNSILQGKPLSKSMCYCCMGHAKKSLDLAFEKEIQGKVVKSMMEADCDLCTYEYEIPYDVLRKYW